MRGGDRWLRWNSSQKRCLQLTPAIHLVPSVPKDFSVAIHCMCFLCSSGANVKKQLASVVSHDTLRMLREALLKFDLIQLI